MHTPPHTPLPLPRRRRWPGALLLPLTLLLGSGCIPFLLAAGEGDGHAGKRRWEQAEAAYLRALSFQQSPEVEQKLHKVREQWSVELVQQAREAQAGGDTATTRRLLVEARARNPANEEAAALLAPILDAEVAQALAAFQQGELVGARNQLRAVLAADPLHAAARQGLEQVLVALAEAWFARGRALESQGWSGGALLAHLLAEQERAGATAAAQHAQALRSNLCEELTFLVVPHALSDNVAAPHVAQRLGSERLAPLLTRSALLRTATTAPSTPRPGVALSLSLERVQPRESVDSTTRSQRYVAGERAVPNPQYARLQEKLQRQQEEEAELERELGRAREEYQYAQARLPYAQGAFDQCQERARQACEKARAACPEDSGETSSEDGSERACEQKVKQACDDSCESQRKALQGVRSELERWEGEMNSLRGKIEQQRGRVRNARSELEAEPRTVSEPVYADFYYEVRRHRRQVAISLALRVEDLGQPGAPPARYTEEGAAEDEDETSGAYWQYGVSGDPLVLRNEWQLGQEAADEALAAVAARVGQLFEAYRSQQAELARRELQQPSEASVEATVRALLVYTGGQPEDLSGWLATTQGLANPGQLRCP
jgi:hypothetical protein